MSAFDFGNNKTFIYSITMRTHFGKGLFAVAVASIAYADILQKTESQRMAE